MKYLLVAGLVLLVLWLWRISRQRQRRDAAPPPHHSARPTAAEKQITETVACAWCKVHLPQSEALIGQGGFYCSEAHRREAGA